MNTVNNTEKTFFKNRKELAILSKYFYHLEKKAFR